MDLIAWILFFILAVLVMVFVTKLVTRVYNIPPQPKGKYQYVNIWHKQIERMYYIIFLIVLMIEMFIVRHSTPYSIFAFIIIFVGTRIFIEYKYRKAQKQYIIYAVTLAYMLIFFLIIGLIG